MSRFMIPRRSLAVVAILGISLLMIVSSALAGKVQLPEGKEVKVKFHSSIKISSGVLGKDVPLLCYLAEDVTIGGKTIIKKGTEGTATVTESIKSSRPGKPGKIVVEFGDLATDGVYKTSDDARIKLKGTVTAEGKGKKLLSYLLGFGFIIKGGQGEISPTTVYTATIAETVILQDQ